MAAIRVNPGRGLRTEDDHGERSSHPSPGFISIAVTDVKASAAFYEEYLGGVRDSFDFGPDSAVFVGWPTYALSSARRPGAAGSLARHDEHPVWWRASDAQALYERAAAARRADPREPFDGPFGRTFTMADPDGYHHGLRAGSAALLAPEGLGADQASSRYCSGRHFGAVVRVERQRRRVHAVAQAGRVRAVVEDVTQVAAARRAVGLRRVMKNERSGLVATAEASTGAKKLGQPVPDSYLASDRNSSEPQPAQRYVPARCSSQSSPVKARSVPF
jgi:catechol 2,3-dioxygenase-like lactoylglutathione lyase family enzyme